MASANITMGVKGIDKTGAAFNSIKNRAKATGAQIRAIMGGALAAAGAYLSFRSIKGGVDELGNLSDMAMKAGTSVDTLTKVSLAFQVAGLNLPVESLARSFQYLKKQTGKGGMDNFFKVAGEISKIDDASERGAALVKNFGRAGLELQPLIDGGENTIKKMQTLTEIMPGVSQAAADAGDAAADSLKIFGVGVHNIFLKIVGNIVSMWSDDFPGGVRAGALDAVNALEIFAKKTKAIFKVSGSNFLAYMAWWKDAWNLGVDKATEILSGTLDAADKDFQTSMAAYDAQREAYKMKLKELDVNDLAGALGGGRAAQTAGEAIGTAAAKAATRITNELIAGGSNQAQKLSLLGPQYQNEQKKQTDLLKKIADNTSKTAENTEGDDLAVADL